MLRTPAQGTWDGVALAPGQTFVYPPGETHQVISHVARSRYRSASARPTEEAQPASGAALIGIFFVAYFLIANLV
jgi:hypothetical protein